LSRFFNTGKKGDHLSKDLNISKAMHWVSR